MTGLYSMLIGFIVGAIIGKFIAPVVLEYMGYTSKDGDVMKYTSLYLKDREGWTHSELNKMLEEFEK